MDPSIEIFKRLAAIEQDAARFKLHHHNHYDSSQVVESDIAKRVLRVQHVLYGADAATAANYGAFFIAPADCLVITFAEVHATKGSDGSAVTVDLEKLTGTTVPGSGTSALSATLSLKTNNNTVQYAVISGTPTSKTLAKGDRLALKKSGTLTSLADVVILLEVQLI